MLSSNSNIFQSLSRPQMTPGDDDASIEENQEPPFDSQPPNQSGLLPGDERLQLYSKREIKERDCGCAQSFSHYYSINANEIEPATEIIFIHTHSRFQLTIYSCTIYSFLPIVGKTNNDLLRTRFTNSWEALFVPYKISDLFVSFIVICLCIILCRA